MFSRPSPQPPPLETEGGEPSTVAPQPAEDSTELAPTEADDLAPADGTAVVAAGQGDAAHDTDVLGTRPLTTPMCWSSRPRRGWRRKPRANGPAQGETDHERLRRLLQFVARQEPGLRWAVGLREDGTTVVVTDLAYGWVPSGITLPAGVRLLEPQRRTGNAAAMLGPTALSVTYSPGDPLGWATDFGPTESSVQPRELPEVEDLGWLLSEATHWRDGLPRMVHTLAKAGAAGTGVVDAELDVLRVHLDTARYQLLAEYPDVDPRLLLNCLLLAATEGIATGTEPRRTITSPGSRC
ncbi:hypothetical protein I552_8417 [Mycobacterium xenopi 3993]|nr:hypothetical protein I552_8417 [Mycobacterium xenopi 3993]